MWSAGTKKSVNKEDENRLGPKNIVNQQSLSASTPVLWALLTMRGDCVLSFRAYEIVNFCAIVRSESNMDIEVLMLEVCYEAEAGFRLLVYQITIQLRSNG